MNSLLQQELRRSRPFDDLEEEAFLNLQRTASALMQAFTRRLKDFSLTPTQYNVLRILRGSHPQTMTCGDVGGRLVTPEPDVTRLFDRLEKRGLAFRARDAADRRVVRTGITDAGLALVAELDKPVPSWLKEMMGHMQPQQLKDLVKLLETARQRVR